MWTNDWANLVEILAWRARHQSDQRAYTFLIDGGAEEVSLTYREPDRQARAIGARLADMGASGERALLLYPAGLDFWPPFTAACMQALSRFRSTRHGPIASIRGSWPCCMMLARRSP